MNLHFDIVYIFENFVASNFSIDYTIFTLILLTLCQNIIFLKKSTLPLYFVKKHLFKNIFGKFTDIILVLFL